MARRTRRHSRIRRNPEAATAAKFPWVPVLLGTAGVGLVGYLAYRTWGTPATPGPGQISNGPATQPTPASSNAYIASMTNPSASPSFAGTQGTNGPDPSVALVSRLRSSDIARQIFALQALLYESSYTNAVPDGIEGPATDGFIASINAASGNGQPGTYGPNTLASIRNGLLTTADASTQATVRNIPFTLPVDVINAVNASAQAVDPQFPALQAYQQAVLPAAPPSSAGQAIVPYAGYGRPYNAQPSNYVGNNPGYGVMQDPRGLNIGAWQFLEGGLHSPIGSGSVADDVHQNPIAGQPGNFWAAYNAYGNYA